MKQYIVQAQVVRVRDGWRCSTGVPSFILDAELQGIIHAAHAQEIAESMLRELAPDAEAIHVSVGEWDACKR